MLFGGTGNRRNPEHLGNHGNRKTTTEKKREERGESVGRAAHRLMSRRPPLSFHSKQLTFPFGGWGLFLPLSLSLCPLCFYFF